MQSSRCSSKHNHRFTQTYLQQFRGRDIARKSTGEKTTIYILNLMNVKFLILLRPTLYFEFNER